MLKFIWLTFISINNLHNTYYFVTFALSNNKNNNLIHYIMKKLEEQIRDFLSKFTDCHGAYDYMVTIDGYSIVVKSCTGLITTTVLRYFADLQSSMSGFIDCGFYVTKSDDFLVLKFYIKKA